MSGPRPAPPRRPGETAAEWVERMTARPDFARLCSSPRVQEALREAAAESAAARRAGAVR